MGLMTIGAVSVSLSVSGCSLASQAKTPLIKPSQVYPIRADLLAIEIPTRQVIRTQQKPYKKELGDIVAQPRPKKDDWVKTPLGQTKGALVGKNRQVIYGFDRLVGPQLDLNRWKTTAAVQIRSDDDRDYAQPQMATALYRKSKAREIAEIGAWKVDFAETHTIYLQLRQPLIPGKTYQLTFADAQVMPVRFTHQPEKQRSEAIQVSQLGFRSDDPAKVAFLSSWMGDGGGVTYAEGMKFALVDDRGQSVFTGETKLSQSKNTPEDGRGRNYSRSDVYVIDFSEFQQSDNLKSQNPATQYQVCVATIGCSFPFPIGNKVWDQPFYTSIRGLYHQRSSIAIGPPYSTYKRPRAFHAADGVNIFQAKARLLDNDQGIYGLPGYQKVLPPTKTNQKVDNAWGGYFDAGDWDRRVQHVEVSRQLIELAELFPTYFESVKLNIPESNNQRPDIIDEALWNLDFFRRLQTADGGIRGGIQSASYSRAGEASWQESLDVLAYAPDPWASYCYAAGAAQVAYWLNDRDPALAKIYRDSAQRAIDYAERERAKPTEPHRNHFQMRDARNLAALSMWRLSQEPRWQKIFRATTVFTDPTQPIYAWDSHDQKDAAFLYLRMPATQTDPKLRQTIQAALQRDADRAVKNTTTTGHKWAKDDDNAPIGWGNSIGAPKAITLLRAHYISQDPKYLKAALLASQFAIGANPLNLSYTTGLGRRSPQHPLITDHRITNQAPPPGITLYGPMDPIDHPGEWYMNAMKPLIYPAFEQWPMTESYFDIFAAPAMNEFTVMQSIGPTAYTFGYFAARAGS
jgi:endoglucanase